jgi:hypothetical protein
MFEVTVFVVGAWAIIMVANVLTCGLSRQAIVQGVVVTVFFLAVYVAIAMSKGFIESPLPGTGA